MRRVAIVVGALMVLAAACGGGSDSGGDAATAPRPTGAQAGDAELVQGRKVYVAECARCHGVRGEGGIGLQLADGRVARRYPNVDDQVAVITDGRNAMPSFGGTLTPEEIRAVARYEREVL
jgi:mono/diheme cytochrome c family protein